VYMSPNDFHQKPFIMANESSLPMKDRLEETLQQVRTAESIFIPKDVFEKLYLNPERPVAGQLRQTFGNPTPLGLVGFLMASTPNAIASMGWRGAGGNGAALLYAPTSWPVRQILAKLLTLPSLQDRLYFLRRVPPSRGRHRQLALRKHFLQHHVFHVR
jgi:hypothetical protein